ncbi:MAG: translation initiation factor eIF-2B [Conexivisphaera sp.]
MPPDETIARIASGRIYGSTEVALAVLEDLRDEASSRDARGFAHFLADYVPKYLAARPTSIALLNALREFLAQYLEEARRGNPPAEAVPRIVESIAAERRAAKAAIASVGARRLRDGESIMIHSYSRTVMGIIRRAAEDLGLRLTVYVTESRPIGEGLAAAEELSRLGGGIRVRVLVDSAVRYFMKDVDRVIVGADAVAANGAVVNKVGTSVVALAAKEARVNFYVAAETYKFSFETITGELVPQVVLSEASLIAPVRRMAGLVGRAIVRAPIFDVTPAEYIDAIITEKGVTAPQAIPLLVRDVYGWPPRVPGVQELLEEVGRLVA